MNHSQLIGIAYQLGYTSISNEGLCKGFSAMWTQAVCSGDLAKGNQSNFLRRLKILENYADSPELLKARIDEIRELEKKGQKLNDIQQDFLEIPAFFEGIALFLNPNQIGMELFGGKYFYQNNETEISSFNQSKELEKLGGLKRAFHTCDQYTPTQLTNYLNNISRELKNKPNVAIDFSANNHSVAVRVVGVDQFELVDTNNLEKMGKRFSSKELAEELNESFFNDSWLDWFIEPKPLVITTSIFTNATNSLDLEKLRTTSQLQTLVVDQANHTLLELAAQHNDVATLERIDFTNIDSDTLGKALAKAAVYNSHDAIDYFLKIPGMNVNKHQFPAIFGAIFHKDYELAHKISKHPSFDPNSSILEGNRLHYIAKTKIPTEETIKYAQHLIDSNVDLNEKNSFGCTPLYEACCEGNLQLVELFFKNGAKLDAVNSENRTVLHAAALSGNATLIQFLLDRGLDCNKVTVKNKTPLHDAILSGNKEAVKTLVAAGANCNVRSNAGFSPLDLACRYNLSELIPTLLAKTTLSKKDLMPDSSLMKLITRCETSVQNEFLKQALQTYLADRLNGTDYLNFLNLGIHKDDKIAAAKALLDTLNGKPTNLKPHDAALKDGLLSSLYALYENNQKNPEKQHSYEIMIPRLNIITSSESSDDDFDEKIPHLPKINEQNESDNSLQSPSSPSPLKKTPF